jgi:SAM-dependent methyltransferase
MIVMPVCAECPVCGNKSTKLLLDGDDELGVNSVGSSRTKLSPGRILQCERCGLAFRSFRPKPEELARLYRDANNSVYEAELPNRFKTARRHRRIVERYRKQPGVMIDVGSASGAFLRTMADAGWKVLGVEPSASQCARAKEVLGIRGEVKQTVLENAELPAQADLVTLWDVLEHVTDPVGFLAQCAAPLYQGGLLFLNVPRIDSFISRSLGPRWPLLLAEHLNYFSAKSLRLCVHKAGLEVIAFGSRPVSFSLGYLAYRLSQHALPGAGTAATILKKIGADGVSIPIWMGEVFAVCRRRTR